MGMSKARVAVDPSSAPHDRILCVARDLFCRDGIHATGIDRILDVANASKMTLYTRFGSKEALLRSALLAEGAEWRARYFDQLFAAGESAVLSRAIAALAAMSETGNFYGCAFMNAIAEHTKGEVWLRELAAENAAAIHDVLSRQAAKEGFADPDMLARQIKLLIDGAVATMMVTGNASALAPAQKTLDAVLAAAR